MIYHGTKEIKGLSSCRTSILRSPRACEHKLGAAPARQNKSIYHGNLKKGGSTMKYRKPTKPKTDKKIFHENAGKTKKINVSPKTMRGGIRL